LVGGHNVVKLIPVSLDMDVVPRRHQGHQDQSEAKREVPALDELGQYGREVDQFCATEHDIEQKNEDDVLLPYEEHYDRHQMGGDGECGHDTDPCTSPKSDQIMFFSVLIDFLHKNSSHPSLVACLP